MMEEKEIYKIIKDAFDKTEKIWCIEVVEEVTNEVYETAKDEEGFQGWLFAKRDKEDVKKQIKECLEKRGLSEVYDNIDWSSEMNGDIIS